jgi:hypothetical protein
MWGGSPAEAKVFNPNIGKLDPKQLAAILLAILKSQKVFVSTVQTYTQNL